MIRRSSLAPIGKALLRHKPIEQRRADSHVGRGIVAGQAVRLDHAFSGF
jgi:hypothetical protein